MDRKKYLSWIIALAMAMSVFAIPTAGFAAEEGAQDDVSAEAAVDTQEQEIDADVNEADAVVEDESAEAVVPTEEAAEESEAVTEEESEPQMPIESKSITAKAYNYAGYLAYAANKTDLGTIVEYADYDTREIFGEVPDSYEYNEWAGKEAIPYGTDIQNELKINIKVGSTAYTTKPDNSNYFTVKFNKVALGTVVTITYTIGNASRTEKIAVTREAEPMIFVRNYVYDGKVHTITKNDMTVKIGNKVLNKSEYYIEFADRLRAVAEGDVLIRNTISCKYRFRTSELFKVLPKGTTIKKLKKGRKSITVKWKKQSAKMNKSRITGYKIQIATDKNFKHIKKTVKVKGYKKTSKKVKGLKAKKTYYVRVKTYIYREGMDYEVFSISSKWSPVKKIKTR